MLILTSFPLVKAPLKLFFNEAVLSYFLMIFTFSNPDLEFRKQEKVTGLVSKEGVAFA